MENSLLLLKIQFQKISETLISRNYKVILYIFYSVYCVYYTVYTILCISYCVWYTCYPDNLTPTVLVGGVSCFIHKLIRLIGEMQKYEIKLVFIYHHLLHSFMLHLAYTHTHTNQINVKCNWLLVNLLYTTRMCVQGQIKLVFLIKSLSISLNVWDLSWSQSQFLIPKTKVSVSVSIF